MIIIPTVNGSTDIFSRLLDDRIVMLGEHIGDDTANVIVAQLLYLESLDPHRDIIMYINSPGGSVTSGFAIYDTMNYVQCDVSTICFGMAASMAAFLLSSGARGKRFAMPNSEIMIHQPKGAALGQVTDIEIHADRLTAMKHNLISILASNSNRSIEEMTVHTERDNFMSASDALLYGIIDYII